ncbi:MAG: hypothetical protein IJT35_05210 [Paludibacteraceae bacterium]|nr:hypothetical protein [Paludibacteraceae bacterium]
MNKRFSLRGLMLLVSIVLCGVQLSAQTTIHELKLESTKSKAIEGKSYLFAVPYTVPVANIVSSTNASVNASQGKVAIYMYDGAQVAKGQDPWVAVGTSGELQSGRCYKMVLNGTTQNTWKCRPTSTPAEAKSVSVSKNAGSSPAISGWNGVANTAWSKATGELKGVTYAYLYNNTYAEYELEYIDRSWNVGEPLIIQTAEAGKMSFTKSGVGFDFGGNLDPGEQFDAPARHLEAGSTTFVISPLDDGYSDKMEVFVQQEAKDNYVIGKDVTKLHGEGTSVLQMWMRAYNTDLAVHTAATENGKAAIELHIYAPATNDYILTMGGSETAQFSLVRDGVYLTKNILNWRLHLTKGDNVFTLQYGYPTPTALDEKKSEKRYTKIVRDGKIYIECNGEWFNLLGTQVR